MHKFEAYDRVLLIHNGIIENSLIGDISKVSKTLFYVDPEAFNGQRTWQVQTFSKKTFSGVNKVAKEYSLRPFDEALLVELIEKRKQRIALIERLVKLSHSKENTTDAIKRAIAALT
jgi:hypothetical protein